MSLSKQLFYRVAKPQDKMMILKFLAANFIKQEPCARALKMSAKASDDTYSSTVDRCLNFPFSTVVTQENGQLAACLLASVWNRTDSLSGADFTTENVPENVQLFTKFLNKAHENFWKVAPAHVDAVIHREIGSVAKEFTRGGVATRMVTENMSKGNLKKYNIGGVLSETTSLANQLLLEKSGFKCLKEIPFSDIVDSTGKQVLQLDDGTIALKLNYKPIEDYQNLPE